MKKLLIVFVILSLVEGLPLLSTAQGIKFEEGLSWDQVKQKAKQENKYIFVDAAASWCVPCKKMDKEVFPLKNVGDFMNAKFVSVHVQMDTSKNDDGNIKTWYKEAQALQKQYKVKAFPTYLFFSPAGKIIHRYLYSLSDTDFLKVAKAALEPDKQYYTMLESYTSGKIDPSKLGHLAIVTKQIGEDSLANKIAKDYLRNCLNKANSQTLLQKKQLDFINTFPSLLSSKDPLFQALYKEGDKADELMNQKGFAKYHVQTVITKEEINPKLWPNKKPVSATPNWNQLTSTIQKKYNKYFTEIVVLDAQFNWYKQKKNWPQVIKYWVKRIDNYGMDTTGLGWVFINNFAWNYVFYYCDEKDTLNKVASWMKKIIQLHPDDQVSVDTYANLLYKAGRKEEAIQWEERAIQLETEAAKKEKRETDMSFSQALDKMKNGISTWTKE